MKFYIAGKITGDENYRAKFQKAAEYFTANGDVALLPSILPDGLTQADYMRICFAMIDVADVVAFLPDYAESRGAMVEWHYCQKVSKQTMHLERMNREAVS